MLKTLISLAMRRVADEQAHTHSHYRTSSKSTPAQNTNEQPITPWPRSLQHSAPTLQQPKSRRIVKCLDVVNPEHSHDGPAPCTALHRQNTYQS